MRDDSGRGSGGRWLECGELPKVELPGAPEGLDVGCDGNRKVKVSARPNDVLKVQWRRENLKTEEKAE